MSIEWSGYLLQLNNYALHKVIPCAFYVDYAHSHLKPNQEKDNVDEILMRITKHNWTVCHAIDYSVLCPLMPEL